MNIPKVEEWVAGEDQIYIYPDGKSIIIPFEKIFNKKMFKDYSLPVFVVKKEVYTNEIGIMTHYINYFINYFDKDKELPLAYLRMKFLIDEKKKSWIKTDEDFIKLLYEVMMTEGIEQGIRDMVEYNYDINVETDTENDYSEELEFTNEQTKLLFMISTGMKILLPLITHYLNSVNKLKDSVLLYNCFHELFNIFGEDSEGNNVYNKLYVTILTRIQKNMSSNSVIWSKQEIFGTDIATFADTLFKSRFVCGVMFKYIFGKHILSLNSKVFERQLKFSNKERFEYDLRESSHSLDNASNLSPADKLEMENSKLDESTVIISHANIDGSMKKILKKMKYEVTEEEIQYYARLHEEDKFQTDLKLNFFAKYYGGFRDLNLINNREHIILMILMKRYLQAYGSYYLPQLLSANVDGKVNKRIIKNNKFLSKIQSSDMYKNLMETKFASLSELDKEKFILEPLSILLNTKFLRVDYDNPELLGEQIQVHQDTLCNEYLNYLNQI